MPTHSPAPRADLGRWRSSAWAVLLAAALAALASRPDAACAEVALGDKPAINHKSLDGQTHTNDSLAGWIVPVIFWASDDNWMFGPERPILKLDAEYRLRGVKFLTFSADPNPLDIRAALNRQKISLTVVCDGRGINGATIKPWGIERVPYSFLLSPTGEIVWAGHPNAIESAIIKAMETTPPKLPKEVWTTLAAQQVKEAHRALLDQKGVEALDYREALRRLSQIKPELLVEPPVLAEAKKLLPLFASQREADRLSLTTYLQAYPAAAKALDQMRKANAAANAANAASQPASQPGEATPAQRRAALAKTRMDAAAAAALKGDRIGAYKSYKQVLERYADTDEAKLAAAQIKALEADETFMASFKLSQVEAEAKALLSLARSYRQAGKTDLAQQTFSQVIAKFPGSAWAEEAQAALSKP